VEQRAAALGAGWGILTSTALLASGSSVSIHANISNFTLFAVSIHIDKLSALFIMIISIVTLFCSIYGIGYIREYYGRYNIGALGALYHAFILGMLLVVTAANGIWFLIAWEIMSLASYFLVVYDRYNAQNVKAGYIYLIMTHVGASAIMLAMLPLYAYTHSFDFAVIQANISLVPETVRAAVFLLTFIGLGVKAGVIPLHIWLPSAHPAAPSHVSALMSGVMIKTGIYMMIRLFLDVLTPIPAWWGGVVLVIGAVSAVLGVLYALTEHDIKRLLAYHSIENIGIILLGLGSAMVFSSQNQPALELLALTATLFHTLNHAAFKSLLFLSAGSVIRATHTRDTEHYGGLIKAMPATALFFLVGSMAISALPPFNGFFSEWITYQSLFGGITVGGTYTKWAFLLGAGALAVTGGLALACFVKAFGVTFLARSRSKAAASAAESPLSMRLGMASLALLCLVLGLGSGSVITWLTDIGRQLIATPGVNSPTSSAHQALMIQIHGSFVSGPIAAALITLAVAGVWLVSRHDVYRAQKTTIAPTWDCGTPLTGRTEITSTGFARSIILVFRGLLKPTLQNNVEYSDAASRYLPTSRTVSLSVKDAYQSYFYRPTYSALLAISKRVKNTQNGNVNAYILYIFLALIFILAIGV
jgi:hydrogenase-4 component B